MKDENFGNFGRTCLSSAISALISLGISTALIFALGAIVYITNDPGGLCAVASAVIAAITFVSAGVIGTLRGGGFLSGIISGAVLLFVFLVISLFFDSTNGSVPYSKMPYSLLSYAVELGLAVLGAFITSKKQSDRKKHPAPRVPKIKHK